MNARDVWKEAERYRDYPRVLYWWATESLIESLAHNHAQLRRKQTLMTVAFLLLASELAAGAASITVTFR